MLLSIVLSACAGTAVSTTEPGGTAAAASTEEVAPVLTPEPAAATPAEESGTKTVEPGESVTVTNNGDDWARITVDEVKTKKSYGQYDVPQVKGNVFVQAKVTYEALADGVDYNPFDWAVFVDGNAVDNYAFVSDGPKPDLNSGTLPKGRKASGYVVYEVAPKGEVLMSYQGSMFSDQPPIFEVVLRGEE